MKNLKEMFNKFANLNGAKFININNYKAETSGEIADHTINTNISVMSAKQKDLNTLQNCNADDLANISKSASKVIALDVYKMALSEMLVSAEKNVSENVEDRTAQSKAQTEAYIHISNSIKLHKETGNIHIFGQHIRKNVKVAGTYKTVNSSDKTLAKQAITKQLDLRAGKFRTFILGNIESITMNGETLDINC